MVGFHRSETGSFPEEFLVFTDQSSMLRRSEDAVSSGVSASLTAICAAFTEQKSLLPKPYITYEVSVG